MRTLASFIFTSLDGFHEGPNGELDWSNVASTSCASWSVRSCSARAGRSLSI
jgi:hypothetical protein